MKLLVLGATGQVGHALLPALLPLGEVVAATRSGRLADGRPCERIDLASADSLRQGVSAIAPDVVVNAAAYTAVDKAEDERDLAYLINATAPAILAEACREADAMLVHYSTDYVFDGQASSPYRETDPTAPIGVYGASKLAGEQAIRDAGVRHLILRTAWVYGNHGGNFMRTMLRLAAERDQLNVVADQFGTPTPAPLIAEVTAAMLALPVIPQGTFHLTASGGTSWHGFAEAIMRTAHTAGLLAKPPTVLPIGTADYPTRAQRPGYSRLDNRSIQDAAQLQLPDWEIALQAVIDSARP
ncbi:dTDP-4-dehydrorhamnose reductase [Pseudoxanthomonas dokdonensis]|uniref:dTDP-4-dehydrorhamnose reductase n=1 Tax=Pseudoxanthomonas dokdonensis TaxID=344882 RepID=A0A0R0CFE8_9GAMM|nr:dTDP-4-dehydrorhamnose reductase [Pseudoxanthomonas dokdonensis]KRG68048.1 dTDP-4-dehydrorhamnose reductase [Pseudoxanthomonas dokdonensis]